MKTTVKVSDSRINRNNNVSGYMEICTELVQAQGYDKTFTYEGNGCQMTYDEFKTTAYKKNNKDVQIDITLDFINGEATITVDAPEKSKLDYGWEEVSLEEKDNIAADIKAIAQKIINAIITGAHTTDMIIRNQGLELQYREFCKAIAWLEIEGTVECHNRNMAHEYGYFITDEGWSRI